LPTKKAINRLFIKLDMELEKRREISYKKIATEGIGGGKRLANFFWGDGWLGAYLSYFFSFFSLCILMLTHFYDLSRACLKNHSKITS